MNLADIRAWLASEQDFAQGRALYALVGTNETYQRLFALGETDYGRQVLLRELGGLLSEEVPQPAAVAAPEPSAAPRVPSPAPELPSPPPGLSPGESPLLGRLYDQLRAVRDERSHLHPQLTAKNVGIKARLATCLRIVALTAQEVELKALVAHVQQHGQLPGPVATADVTEKDELHRRLLNARSRRSKAKQHPERLVAIEAEITLILSKLAA